jgi:PAS domain S-box-containing protein
LPDAPPETRTRTDAARVTPRSIFSYWRLTWRRLTAVFGPPLLVLIVGVIAYGGTTHIAGARSEVQQSRAVTETADEIVERLTDAETGQRGFLITDNPQYLEPYIHAVDSLPLAIARLRTALNVAGSTAATRLEVDSLVLFTNAKMTELVETVRLQRTRGAAAALAVVKTNHGWESMRGARRIASSVRAQEAARLAARVAEESRYTGEVTLVVLIGTSVAFLIALLVNMLLAREAATQTRLAVQRDEALGTVTMANEQLEAQSLELQNQTQELESANEELVASNEQLQATFEELEEQERSFRALIETIPQLVWSITAAGDAEYVNEQWSRYSGATEPGAKNSDWREFVHGADRELVDDKWGRSFRSGDPFDVECRLRRASDGAYRWFLCRAVPLRDDSGTIIRWFGTCTDVHDQRRSAEGASVLAEASAALAASHDPVEMMRTVAQLAVPRFGDWCAVDLLDADGTSRRVATAHADGKEPANTDEPERPHARVVAPLVVSGRTVGSLTVVSAESGQMFGPSDVSRVQELARRIALALENARLFNEIAAARDAEAQSHARLKESEAKLVLSMQAGGLGSWEWDIAHDRVVWSPQTERMHGLAEGTFPGTREAFDSFIHPDDRERVSAEIARTLAERSPRYYIKYRFVRPDGAVRWLEGFARLETDANGNPTSFLGVSHDVTEREELLEAEHQARRDAEAANAAKAIFLTTMSHELRTPLNAVSGYVDLLEMGVRGPVNVPQREDLRRIRRASQHLLALINDILNYARLEAGKVELHLSTVTLGDALSEMEALIAPQLQSKGVNYEYRKCDGGIHVRADREKLDQILLNLVGNAVKFTDTGGRITLQCSATDGRAQVIVTDTGRGIPRGKLDAIFDPFVQVDRHLTPERQQGVGLGLAISRDLARAMDGDITVQSDTGKGATFVLTLPFADPARVSGALGKVEGVQ